tara:strand:+ start:154 stop:951 length:798 start_codon:yes stop_codon:yes gene_type:complete
MNSNSKKREKTLSIILPTFNSIKTISRAVHSILIQEINYFIEIIIIDDCSTDGTYEKIMTFKSTTNFNFIIIRNKVNMGVGYSRNIGLSNSSGDFIAFLDSDDYWLKDKLKVQLIFLESNPNIDLVITDYLIENQNTDISISKYIQTPRVVTLRKNKYINYIPNSTCIIRSYLAKKSEYPLIRVRNDYIFWNSLLSLKKDMKAINCFPGKAYAVYGFNPGISNNKIKLIKFQWITYRNYFNYNVFQSILGIMLNILKRIINSCQK